MLLVWAVLLEVGIEIQSLMHNTCESLPKVSIMCVWHLKLEFGPHAGLKPLYSPIC